jgi:hypothetical protein
MESSKIPVIPSSNRQNMADFHVFPNADTLSGISSLITEGIFPLVFPVKGYYWLRKVSGGLATPPFSLRLSI